MKYEFDLDDYRANLLHTVINNERIKYLSYITKCLTSPDRKYKGLYTVEYCVSKVQALDELEATMLGTPVEYTHDEQALTELKEYCEA